MPAHVRPAGRTVGAMINEARSVAKGAAAGGTDYVVDPTSIGPVTINGTTMTMAKVCVAIIGNLAVDHLGRPTYTTAGANPMTGWGIGVFSTSTGLWTKLGG